MPPDERASMTGEFWLRILMFLFILYFIFFEFVSFLRDGMGYIKDVFNWLDISSFGLNIYLAFLTATDFREKDDI